MLIELLKRRNRFHDTSRFGHAEIRVYYKKGRGRKSPHYLLKCGCCEQKIKVFCSGAVMEIGGIHGTIDDWREILLPLLRIGRRGPGYIDLNRTKKGELAYSKSQS